MSNLEGGKKGVAIDFDSALALAKRIDYGEFSGHNHVPILCFDSKGGIFVKVVKNEKIYK